MDQRESDKFEGLAREPGNDGDGAASDKRLKRFTKGPTKHIGGRGG